MQPFFEIMRENGLSTSENCVSSALENYLSVLPICRVLADKWGLEQCCLALAEAGASEEGNADVVELMLDMWRLR
jgi:hypothetical protein